MHRCLAFLLPTAQNRLLCGPDSALDWKRLFTCFLGRDYLLSMGILAKLKHSLPTCKFGF